MITNNPYVGVICQVILDGYGYWLKPHSYELRRPRLRSATPRADLGESYVDLGVGKRRWRFTVLAAAGFTNYDGTPTSWTGQQYRDTLQASYERVDAVLGFTDPHGDDWSVRFDNLVERVPDVRTQVSGLVYELDVELMEA